MAESVPVSFGDIFQYHSNTGMVIADTSEIREKVISGLKYIFGTDDFSTDEGTPNGLLIDGLTALFKDFSGVTAQNINGLNAVNSIGAWLDSLGAIYGIDREERDTDNSYRRKILRAYSRGSGYVQSLYNALSGIQGAKHICVLNNGKAEVAVVPNSIYGMAVDPHSVFISVLCEDNIVQSVIDAIRSTLSAGCGFHNEETHGEKVEVDDIVFYRPSERFVKVEVSVNPYSYTGMNLDADVANAVQSLIGTGTTCASFTAQEMIAAIARGGYAIVPTGIKIFIKDSAEGEWNEQIDGRLTILPYQYVEPSSVEVVIS